MRTVRKQATNLDRRGMGDDMALMQGPQIGDAWGEMLRAEYADFVARQTGGQVRRRPVMEINEREDGHVDSWAAARYIAGVESFLPCERRTLDRVRGRTLDVGAGAGRVSMALQERGVEVTALDTSRGAIEVARRWGVRTTVNGTVADHIVDGVHYDSIVLYGNNLGLLESRERAGFFLAELAALAAPGGRIIGQGNDPYAKKHPVHLAYYEHNRRRGRLAGQWTMRQRQQNIASPWYEYLYLSPHELEELLSGSPWRLVDVDDAETPVYFAELCLV